jgi:predicted RNA-binding protein with PIN domain
MSELSDGYNLIGLSQVIKILKDKLLSVSNFRIITFFLSYSFVH